MMSVHVWALSASVLVEVLAWHLHPSAFEVLFLQTGWKLVICGLGISILIQQASRTYHIAMLNVLLQWTLAFPRLHDAQCWDTHLSCETGRSVATWQFLSPDCSLKLTESLSCTSRIVTDTRSHSGLGRVRNMKVCAVVSNSTWRKQILLFNSCPCRVLSVSAASCRWGGQKILKQKILQTEHASV